MLRPATGFRATPIMLPCALSLLLCLTTCVLGVRSYWYASDWDSDRLWNSGGISYRAGSTLISYHGGLCYCHYRLWTDIFLFSPAYNVRRFDTKTTKWKGRTASTGYLQKTYAGFGYERIDSVRAGNLKATGTHRAIAAPYWAVAALFALPPAAWLLAFRWARKAAWRLRHQRCFHCGYDLRASRDRCPECGRAPSGTSETVAHAE
jgi:hypothetical protein